MQRTPHASLAAVLALLTHTTPALSQPRRLPVPPSSRQPSTLTTSDSTTLVQASARVVLAPQAVSACIVRIDDTLNTPVGTAFVRTARASAATLPAPRDSAGVLSVTLLGLRDGDTATVTLRISGTVPPPARAFWVNDIDYHFVRADTPERWRFIGDRIGVANDYLLTDDRPAPRIPCLNRRRD